MYKPAFRAFSSPLKEIPDDLIRVNCVSIMQLLQISQRVFEVMKRKYFVEKFVSECVEVSPQIAKSYPQGGNKCYFLPCWEKEDDHSSEAEDDHSFEAEDGRIGKPFEL